MPFTSTQKAAFDEYYAKACDLKDDNKLVHLMYCMLKLLREAALGYETVVQPKQMGIHPQNRSGKKMTSTTMQKKGHKIVKVGFSPLLCATDKAIAFEVNPLSSHIEDHTIATTIVSSQFAQYQKGVIRGGSCGCGHLNQFLAAVGDGAETHFSDLCDAGDNHLASRIVAKGNVDLGQAIGNGIDWFMIKWDVERDYPELPGIIQRGLNAEHHVGEGFIYLSMKINC